MSMSGPSPKIKMEIYGWARIRASLHSIARVVYSVQMVVMLLSSR